MANFNKALRIPVLTRRRIWAAFAVALVTDGVQFLTGPLGWIGLDQVIDVIAMLLLTALVGFHPLFLPTFVIELFPAVGMIPTWTACLAVVIGLRHKEPPLARPPPGPPPDSTPPRDIIDI